MANVLRNRINIRLGIETSESEGTMSMRVSAASPSREQDDPGLMDLGSDQAGHSSHWFMDVYKQPP